MGDGFAYTRRDAAEKIWDRVQSLFGHVEIEEIVGDNTKLFVKYSNTSNGEYDCVIATGENGFGQLGIGNTETQIGFEKIKLEKIQQIVCGHDRTVVLMKNGDVMGCGSNYNNQLGLGTTVSTTDIFKAIKIDKVKKIMCAYDTTYFLLKSGELMACGGENRKSITEIADLPGKVIEATGYNDNILLLLSNGTLVGRGGNEYGQLGLGDHERHNKFEIIRGVPKNITKIFTRYGTSLIQLSDGTLMGTGFHTTLGIKNEYINKFRVIPNIPKNIKDFNRIFDTMIILLTDDTIIQIGMKLIVERIKIEISTN